MLMYTFNNITAPEVPGRKDDVSHLSPSRRAPISAASGLGFSNFACLHPAATRLDGFRHESLHACHDGDVALHPATSHPRHGGFNASSLAIWHVLGLPGLLHRRFDRVGGDRARICAWSHQGRRHNDPGSGSRGAAALDTCETAPSGICRQDRPGIYRHFKLPPLLEGRHQGMHARNPCLLPPAWTM